ncbi:uncharacterized protein LOC113332173 [Papaver somniferum]|uniref:uncharacterized protein LOC113332173 n=1 Tax=Papaver somniferum TaxID=3469 RepID=UPI000E6F7B96|nr:uncharacterized protein LOC113332173 [Papaver somniferum]
MMYKKKKTTGVNLLFSLDAQLEESNDDVGEDLVEFAGSAEEEGLVEFAGSPEEDLKVSNEAPVTTISEVGEDITTAQHHNQEEASMLLNSVILRCQFDESFGVTIKTKLCWNLEDIHVNDKHAEYEPYTPNYKETPYKKPVVEVIADINLPKVYPSPPPPAYVAPVVYPSPSPPPPAYVAPVVYPSPSPPPPAYVAPVVYPSPSPPPPAYVAPVVYPSPSPPPPAYDTPVVYPSPSPPPPAYVAPVVYPSLSPPPPAYIAPKTTAQAKFIEENGREFKHFEFYELYKVRVAGFDVV